MCAPPEYLYYGFHCTYNIYVTLKLIWGFILPSLHVRYVSKPYLLQELSSQTHVSQNMWAVGIKMFAGSSQFFKLMCNKFHDHLLLIASELALGFFFIKNFLNFVLIDFIF